MDSSLLPRHAYNANDMINGYKVLDCRIRQQHDWSKCFYAHPQERARRRSLQKYRYAAVLCPDMINSGSCRHGDACGKSHSVFEFWLHADKYCTRMCYDGAQCQRPFCFFAHVPKELRNIRGSSSNTRDRLQETSGQPQRSPQPPELEAAVVAAQPTAHAAAAAANNCSSNRWQACVPLGALASSASLCYEVLPLECDKLSNAAGSGGRTRAGSCSSSSSSSSRHCGSSGSCGSRPRMEAAGSTADAAWSGVAAQLCRLPLQSGSRQGPGASAMEAADSHEQAGTEGAHADWQLNLQSRLGTVTSSSCCAGFGSAAGSGCMRRTVQPADDQHPPAAAALAAAFGGSSMPTQIRANSLQPANANVSAGAAPPSIAQEACVVFSDAAFGNSSSSHMTVDSTAASQQGVIRLTRSTAVDPADSVLDDVVPLGLFGAVQPRTVHKQRQQQRRV